MTDGISTHEGFMRQAIALSQAHMRQGHGGPFGAVIVVDGKVVAEGGNQVTSTNDPTAHAEIVAIRRACDNSKTFELRKAVLYSSCEPCPMCLSAAYWARISGIYYACTREDAARHQFDDEFIYREIAVPIAERRLPMRQILRSEAERVFQEWDNKSDKIRY